MRRPPVVLGMAVITALALVVAVALILFQVNPQQDETQRGIDRQEKELVKQVREINRIICSQAQTTANAYRFRSLTPSGDIEPISHFLTRMQAQRQTLRLSRGRNCAVAPGFPPFELQLERALREINGILSHFGAERREPIPQDLEAKQGALQGLPNAFQVSPEFGVPPNAGSHTGIGEEGVPYLPPKGQKHEPPEVLPESPEATPVEREPKASPPASVGSEGSQSPPESTEGEEESKRPSLSEAAKEATGNAEAVVCSAIREVHELCSSDDETP